MRYQMESFTLVQSFPCIIYICLFHPVQEAHGTPSHPSIISKHCQHGLCEHQDLKRRSETSGESRAARYATQSGHTGSVVKRWAGECRRSKSDQKEERVVTGQRRVGGYWSRCHVLSCADSSLVCSCEHREFLTGWCSIPEQPHKRW